MDVLAFSFCIKETAELDAAGQDARALGQLLVHEMEPVRTKKRPEELESKLHTFFYRATVLREVADVYPWFPKTLFQVLRNLPSRPRTTKAKLAEFTERDALITGRAMTMLMLSNATPDAAVDEWILTFPALQEIESAHPFLRPFMNVIAEHLLSTTDFGLKMRLFGGAGLSVFDIISDVYMIFVFLGSEETRGVAHVNIVASKMVEMVFESIPAAIIQTRAFITSNERSRAALGSIVISCCTTGFAAATMWYAYDTSPEKRRRSPKLAGATPDTSRGPFFVVLVMSGALQVVAKSFSSALLLIASPNYFLVHMAADHFLYQVYVAARCDHRNFRPGAGIPQSVVFRIMEKVITDYTSCWVMRNPLTMHNCYFLFNQLTAHASVFVSVRVYASSGLTDMPERMLWIGAGSLFAAWALTYIVLACMVKPEYRYQFYTTETAVQYIRAEHVGAKDDEVKMFVFAYHVSKWAHYKDEVRDFTHANWARWNEEKPAWFTEEVIQRVPDEHIPVAALASLNAAAHGGQRRRSSAGFVEMVKGGE
ncbi:hypothetical protein TeGR_g2736 [Tetraparma gracilis]|uniref:Uncharacterized protein n=1 Tax=Tetraparma gracilis TaxID=2962635 RepID=A0ABQ6M4T7_9STRA|nr:hypothetical protein TeGR_g2736 [Tetraparma gracilis]